jgi:hypothetical protein
MGTTSTIVGKHELERRMEMFEVMEDKVRLCPETAKVIRNFRDIISSPKTDGLLSDHQREAILDDQLIKYWFDVSTQKVCVADASIKLNNAKGMARCLEHYLGRVLEMWSCEYYDKLSIGYKQPQFSEVNGRGCKQTYPQQRDKNREWQYTNAVENNIMTGIKSGGQQSSCTTADKGSRANSSTYDKEHQNRSKDREWEDRGEKDKRRREDDRDRYDDDDRSNSFRRNSYFRDDFQDRGRGRGGGRYEEQETRRYSQGDRNEPVRKGDLTNEQCIFAIGQTLGITDYHQNVFYCRDEGVCGRHHMRHRDELTKDVIRVVLSRGATANKPFPTPIVEALKVYKAGK